VECDPLVIDTRVVLAMAASKDRRTRLWIDTRIADFHRPTG
jgi:hypothetical protein